jgi:hypothetical protein
LRIFTLLRFLSFIALLYLALHVLFSRLISRPDSKLLWFFSVLTLPLTRPIERWIVPEASGARLRLVSLIVYGVVWLAFVVLDNAATARP